jgi:bifunctional non-homologous end joining protein LigD
MLCRMSRPTIDQLPLELVVEPPQAPLALRPMLPRSSARLPVDGRHLLDVSWGGLRALAHIAPDGPRLIVHGRDLGAGFPELTRALEDIASWGTVLDGEIVVPDASGGLDRDALRDRLRGMGSVAATSTAVTTPAAATLVISDLLWLDGGSLMAEPLRARRARLTALRLDRPHLVALAPAADGGARLLDAARERGLAAVIAKRLDSPYLSGVRSRLWRSVRVDAVGDTAADSADAGDAWNAPLLALLRTLPLGGDG